MEDTLVQKNGPNWGHVILSPRKNGLTSLFKEVSQVGMNGDTFSIKAPKECSKKFAAIFKRKFLLPEEIFLEYSFCS